MSIVMTENDVKAAVMDWLATLPGVHAFRRNVGAMQYLKASGKKGVVRFNDPGMSDIWAIGPGGVHIEIELKRPGKKPTDAQREWLEFAARMGAVAFWCDSLNSCIVQLRSEYQKRGWTWLGTWEVWL